MRTHRTTESLAPVLERGAGGADTSILVAISAGAVFPLPAFRATFISVVDRGYGAPSEGVAKTRR